jgi:hypothetical protein
MKKNTVTPIRKPAPPEPEIELHFSREALDSMIDLVCQKVVATRRAREAAQRRTSAPAE